MKDDDRAEGHDAEATGPTSASRHDPGNHEGGELMPLLVDGEGSDFSVVWLYTRRSELAPGVTFSARGQRWVVTGLSPSGVTFTCRAVVESPDE